MAEVVTVALTGLNARPENPAPGMAVARCLAETKGTPVRLIGLGYESLEPGLYRRDLFDSTYLLPFPTTGRQAFKERLLAIHAAEKIDVLIPCLDAELPACIALAESLAKSGIATFLPTQQQFTFRAKDRLVGAATEAGISTPETCRVSDPAFFYTCLNSGWTYPLVVKGSIHEAVVAYTSSQAAAAFDQIVSRWGHPILVQKHIAGDECNLCTIGDGQGGLIGPVMMKKRALTDKGKAWAGVCIEDDILLGAARKLLAHLKWRGPCEIEGIRSPNGDFHLLEINPRFPAWVYFTHGVGRNLPAALVEVAQGRPPPTFARAAVGTMFIRYAEEVVLPMHDFECVVTTGGLLKHEEALAWTA
jgi:carbamoyl-phosphate synthase large subunit